MAQSILPGAIPEVAKPTIKMPTEAIDTTSFKEVGNKLIQSANTNFKLYANNQWEALSSEAYQQFGNDPVQLGQALNKIQTVILPNLPKEMADSLKTNMYFQSIGLVQRSAQNQINQRDIENKELAQASIDNASETVGELYKNVLRNNIAKPEDKINETNAIYEQTLNNIIGNANIKNSAGKNVFSKSDIKKMTNFQDLQLESAKQMFDQMLIDCDDVDNCEAKDYYTKQVLQPERFMAQNYMDRKHYEQFKTYTAKELKRIGADIKNAQFNESIMDALEYQIDNLPTRLEELRSKGVIDSKLIDKIEQTNIKFDELDPTKPETPFGLLQVLQLLSDKKPSEWLREDMSKEEKENLLAQSTYALSTLQQFADKYGLSQKDIETTRNYIVKSANNKLFSSTFKKAINAQESIIGKPTAWTEITRNRGIMYGLQAEIRDYLANTMQAIAQQDEVAFNQAKQTFDTNVIKLKYSTYINDSEWERYQKDPQNYIFAPKAGGRPFKIRSIDHDNYDVVIEEL